MNRIKVGIFGFILAISAISCKNDKPRNWDDVVSDSVLHVAIDYNALGAYRCGDSLCGVQYSMVCDICDDINLTPSFDFVNDYREGIEGLRIGKYDLLASLIPSTTEFQSYGLLTDKVCLDKPVLVQRISTKQDAGVFVDTQLKLPGHVISLPQGSLFLNRLKNLENEIGDTLNVKVVDKYSSGDLVALVALGDLDYTVCGYRLASAMSRSYPQIDYTVPIGFNQVHSWAVSPSDTVLLNKINAWLSSDAEKYFK